MSQLKEKMKVVMLPTEKADNLPLGLVKATRTYDDGLNGIIDGKLYWNKNPSIPSNTYPYKSFIPQHLYVVSDKEVTNFESKTWYYYPNEAEGLFTQINGKHKHPIFNISHTEGYGISNKYRKVEASTDKSLGLPGLRESFVSKYAEKGGIDEIMVDMTKKIECECYYTKFCQCTILDPKFYCRSIDNSNDLYPRVDENNCIIISKAKDSWIKEELPIKILIDMVNYCEKKEIYDKLGSYGDFYYKAKTWIKNNN